MYLCSIHHLQPPYVGAQCCEPDCAAPKSCLWYKSKRVETLGKPLCKKCNDRYLRAAKMALKVGGGAG